MLQEALAGLLCRERSSITGQGSDDPAGLEHDREWNGADNISLRLYLKGQGNWKVEKTWAK